MTVQQLSELGLSLADLKGFLASIDRARAAMAASRGGSSPNAPTFADFLGEIDKSLKTGKEAEPGAAAAGASKGDGRGPLRGVAESLKETVDLEYQDVLEEYYRSLADPAWKKGRGRR
jgi:hypothetical protein